MSTAWSTFLDEIEADLAATETALRDRAPLPEAAAPGPPAGTLPDDLEPRARALLARTHDLETRAERDRDRIGSSLRALAGRHQAPERPRTGALIDYSS